MKVLAKTSGSFIIPLGRGEFVLPDFSEVEDSALLRSEEASGRVVIASEAEFEPIVEEPTKSTESVEPADVPEAAPRRRKRN